MDILRFESDHDTTPLRMYRVANMFLLKEIEMACLHQFSASINAFNYMQLSSDAHALPFSMEHRALRRCRQRQRPLASPL